LPAPCFNQYNVAVWPSSPDFADVDLCLKMRHARYLIVYTPFAKLCCVQIFSRERADFSLEPLLQTAVMLSEVKSLCVVLTNELEAIRDFSPATAGSE
jgi:hypothetical protein